MASGADKSMRVAIVGASSLRGKEVKLVLEERNFPASEIILLDEPALAGTLTEAGGEPTFIRALDEDSFEKSRFVFFAGSANDAERNWQAAQRSGARVIDLTGGVSGKANTTTWIPSLETVLPQRTIAGNGSGKLTPYSSPSPKGSRDSIIFRSVEAGLFVISSVAGPVVTSPPTGSQLEVLSTTGLS